MAFKKTIPNQVRVCFSYSLAFPLFGVILPIILLHIIFTLSDTHGEGAMIFGIAYMFIVRILLPIFVIAGIISAVIELYKGTKRRFLCISGFMLNFVCIILLLYTTSQVFKTSIVAVRAIFGNSSMKCSLAERYFDGNGVSKDVDSGMKWLLSAAEEGNQRAQLLLGYIYSGNYFKTHGIMRYRDDAVAKMWYENCIRSNDESADGRKAKWQIEILERRNRIEKLKKHKE